MPEGIPLGHISAFKHFAKRQENVDFFIYFVFFTKKTPRKGEYYEYDI